MKRLALFLGSIAILLVPAISGAAVSGCQSRAIPNVVTYGGKIVGDPAAVVGKDNISATLSGADAFIVLDFGCFADLEGKSVMVDPADQSPSVYVAGDNTTLPKTSKDISGGKAWTPKADAAGQYRYVALVSSAGSGWVDNVSLAPSNFAA